MGDDGGTFSALNYDPDRPEIEIMQEYAEAWDYLYEPSRYLARAYRYYLAMQPDHRSRGLGGGLDFDAGKQCGHGMLNRWIGAGFGHQVSHRVS